MPKDSSKGNTGTLKSTPYSRSQAQVDTDRVPPTPSTPWLFKVDFPTTIQQLLDLAKRRNDAAVSLLLGNRQLSGKSYQTKEELIGDLEACARAHEEKAKGSTDNSVACCYFQQAGMAFDLTHGLLNVESARLYYQAAKAAGKANCSHLVEKFFGVVGDILNQMIVDNSPELARNADVIDPILDDLDIQRRKKLPGSQAEPSEFENNRLSLHSSLESTLSQYDETEVAISSPLMKRGR